MYDTSIIKILSGGSYSTNYGMGSCQTWNRLTRDLHIDLIKGHVLSGRYVITRFFNCQDFVGKLVHFFIIF